MCNLMLVVSVVLLLVVVVSCGCGKTPPGDPPGEGRIVPMYDLFEITFTSDGALDNPFHDVPVRAAFISPRGERIDVEGFYYGGKEWRVRFVPREHGRWQYEAEMTTPGGRAKRQKGAFECKGVLRHGSLGISPKNPYRLEYEDGTPFYPVGVQTCGYFNVGFDGPTPEGRWRTVPAAEWAGAFEGAVNLIRWQLGAGTRNGCALPLIPVDGPADRYDTELARKMDALLRLQKKHGFSHIMILYQDMSLWGAAKSVFGPGRDLKEYKSVGAANLPLQDKYLRYVVARFGCFVDIWELFNEDSWAPEDYLAHLAKVIRDADPYDRLITTNYARPRADWCEVVTWHEYMGMPPNGVDTYVTKEIGALKSFGKPVLNTEFGNQGWLSNYDPVKWRIAVWAAFMNESSILFWGMSGRKTVGRRPYRGNANAYLGAESRGYFRVLNEFTRDMPIDMRPVAIGYHEHNDVRTYALSNGKVTAVDVHHFSDHAKPFQLGHPLFVHTGPGTFKVRWIDPADGKTLGTDEVETSSQYVTLPVPPVPIDAACRLDRVE